MLRRWQEVVAQAGGGKNVNQHVGLNTVGLIPHAATHTGVQPVYCGGT